MSRKDWFILGLCLIVLFVISFFIYTAFYTEPTWHEVTTFIGTSEGGAYPFKVKGDKFRFVYSVAQDDYLDLLTLFVIAPDSLERWTRPPQKINATYIKNYPHGPNKWVDVTIPLSNKTVRLNLQEYDWYLRNHAVNDAVADLLWWKAEQLYENTGKLLFSTAGSEFGVTSWYIDGAGTRKMLRNGYTDFFYAWNTPTKTSTSYAGAGEYYLMIDVYAVDSWTVTVEDYY